MKKILSGLLCMMMAMLALAGAAVGEDAAAASKLIVGSTTKMSGVFFTDMWGNNTADMDVRYLLHDYSTVAFADAGNFAVNNTAVALAEVADNAAGNRTYTFELQQDLLYSDGTPITARDYVFSALLISSPQIKEIGGLGESMSHIIGHTDFSTGAKKEFSGVRLLDDYRFSLTIDGDYLPYFYELTMVAVTPYPISVIAPGCDVADDGRGAYFDGALTSAVLLDTILNTRTGYMSHPSVTSGAYKLVSYDAQTNVVELTINPYYKGNYEGQKPSIETLVFKEVKNATMLDEFSAGTVDVLNKVSSGEVIARGMEMVAGMEANTSNYLRSGMSFVAFACEQEIPSSADVRKAVALCLDQNAFVEQFLGGNGVPVYGYYGYGQWMISQINLDSLLELDLYEQDLNAAGQMLTNAGWQYNAQGTPFLQGEDSLRYRRVDNTLQPLVLRFAKPKDNTAADIVEALLRDSFAVVGIQMETTELDMQTMLNHYYRQQERTYDMFFLASNFSLIFDPYYTYNTDELYQGVMNTSGLRSEELMKLAQAMREVETNDTETYLEKWMDFQKGWVQELPMAPLASNVYFDFFRVDLNNYFPNAYWSWGAAMLYATLGEPPVEEATEETIEIIP